MWLIMHLICLLHPRRHENNPLQTRFTITLPMNPSQSVLFSPWPQVWLRWDSRTAFFQTTLTTSFSNGYSNILSPSLTSKLLTGIRFLYQCWWFTLSSPRFSVQIPPLSNSAYIHWATQRLFANSTMLNSSWLSSLWIVQCSISTPATVYISSSIRCLMMTTTFFPL
jgi:hypothetical protein